MLPFIQTAYLFALGSIIGWVLEFFYRKFFDPVNVERKWLNPGFLTGPYLPLYGFALLLLFWLRRLEGFIPIENSYIRKAVLFLIMAACITALEYFTGLIFIVRLKIMLWDYTQFWGNIQGIICPMYSFFWLVLSFGYCFFLDPTITQTVEMLMKNLQFTFFVGLFYGVFFIDLWISINNMVNISEFAREHNIIVKIDELRAQIEAFREKTKGGAAHFFVPLRFSDTLHNSLERYREFRENLSLGNIRENLKDNINKNIDKIKKK
jgi:Predicted membrane protein